MGRIPKALTIAGSDSGGGAGIQADLKTFSALGVFGTTAITAITAQNTLGVTEIMKVNPEVVRAQIQAVIEDIGTDVIKTGMLYSEDIIEVVAEEVSKIDVPIVVDPVMVAKTGAPLLKDEAIEALVKKLFPLTTLLTPNVHEAERLVDMEIKDVDDMKEAAIKISKLGPKGVVVKGGHVGGDKALDVLYLDGKFYTFESERLPPDCTHGTGCSFASAIAAYIALGKDVIDAVAEAKKFITNSIRFGLKVGRGVGAVNPMATLYREAERYRVLEELKMAIERLESIPGSGLLVPECQTNFGYALSRPIDRNDVAAVPGRIIRFRDRMKAFSCPEFGASEHVANIILEVMKYDPEIRSAINLRYSEDIMRAVEEANLEVSYFDRREEPEEVKAKEGMTMKWGVKVAIERIGKVPDVIYDTGGWGKEPMIVILGESPFKVIEKLDKIMRRLK